MQLKLYTFLLTLTLTFSISFVIAADIKYSFKQISKNEGIPSSINKIHTDNNGFLWAVASNNGVVRYNGKDVRYYSYFNKQDSLPSNRVYQIIEDTTRSIWVLTEGGVAKYIPNYDRFSIQYYNSKPFIAHSACLIPDGIIWGGVDHIYIYKYASDKIEKIIKFNTEEHFYASSVQMWNDEEVICFDHRKGIYKVNLNNGTSCKLNVYPDRYVLDMIIDNNHNFWVAPYNQGIKCYSKDGELIKHYNTSNSGLNSNVVLCITPFNGCLWMGTDGGGINILCPQSGDISTMYHISADPHSFPSNTVLCLYNDTSSRDIWAGTSRGGIINIRKVPIKTYTFVNPGYNKGLSESVVLNVCEDSMDDDIIWIGTDGGGVNRMNISNETFVHYRDTWSDKVVSLTELSRNELLLSIFSKGLYVFDKRTGIKRPFLVDIPSLDYRLKYSGLSVNVFKETQNSVLILSNPIYRYHIDSKAMEEIIMPDDISFRTMVSPIAKNDSCTFIHDSYSVYYINGNKLVNMYQLPEGMELRTASVDSEMNFWLGTSSGLYVYSSKENRAEKITTGLFDEVNSVLCDNNGYVWIGTGSSLFSYHPSTGRFLIHDESDGVNPNEYLSKAKLLKSNGNIFLGGVNGLVCINKSIDLDENTLRPDIRLAGFTIGGENRMKDISPEMHIELPSSTRNIHIRLMAYGDDILRTKVYRYQIGNEMMESYKPEIVIPSLAPGTYYVKASCNTKDGEWTPVQTVMTLVVSPPWYMQTWFIVLCLLGGISVIVLSFGYTLYRQKRRHIFDIQEHSRKMSEDKVRFMINVSHELRTPLTLIYGPLERILKDMNHDSSVYVQLSKVFHQVKRMRDIINMVLDVRKMEMSDIRMELTECDINKLIQDVSEDYKDELNNKNISLKLDLDTCVRGMIIDKPKIVIVLNNLIMNALKHSPENTSLIVKSELLPSKSMVRISVSDHGCGLQYADSNRLFSRFYQATNETGGSGIGLSYSKILVELHGGNIGAYNNIPCGAVFYFDLPVDKHSGVYECKSTVSLNDLITEQESIGNSYDELGETIKKELHERILFKAYSILITDDNNSMTDFLSEELKSYFDRVFVASNGSQALEILESEKIDVLLSDVMMPVMDGFELCSRVKEDLSISHIPVVLLTARTDAESRDYGYKLGADAYLPKPFGIYELLNVLSNILYNRKQIKEHYSQTDSIMPSPEETTFSVADENFINKVNTVVRENLSNPDLDIAFICKEVGVSRASLYNKMKAITDMGAGDYITRLRLDEAMHLIRTTDLTFAEIADKTGFSTARYFSTIFKQHTGKTPTQYKASL